MVKSLQENAESEWLKFKKQFHIRDDDSKYSEFEQYFYRIFSIVLFSKKIEVKYCLKQETSPTLIYMHELLLESLGVYCSGFPNAALFTLRAAEDSLLDIILNYYDIQTSESRFTDRKKNLSSTEYFAKINSLHDNYKRISTVFHGSSSANTPTSYLLDIKDTMEPEVHEILFDGVTIIFDILISLSKPSLKKWRRSELEGYLSNFFSPRQIQKLYNSFQQ